MARPARNQRSIPPDWASSYRRGRLRSAASPAADDRSTISLTRPSAAVRTTAGTVSTMAPRTGVTVATTSGPDVADRVGGSARPADSREAHEHRRPPPDLREERSRGDVGERVAALEIPVRTRAAGVDHVPHPGI